MPSVAVKVRQPGPILQEMPVRTGRLSELDAAKARRLTSRLSSRFEK